MDRLTERLLVEDAKLPQERCPVCKGTGWDKTNGLEHPCQNCNGLGFRGRPNGPTN